MMFRSVVLPAPLAPMMLTISPAPTVKSMAFAATKPEKALWMPRHSRMGPSCVIATALAAADRCLSARPSGAAANDKQLAQAVGRKQDDEQHDRSQRELPLVRKQA